MTPKNTDAEDVSPPIEYYCRVEGPTGELHGQAIAKTLDDAAVWLSDWQENERHFDEALEFTIRGIGVVG